MQTDGQRNRASQGSVHPIHPRAPSPARLLRRAAAPWLVVSLVTSLVKSLVTSLGDVIDDVIVSSLVTSLMASFVTSLVMSFVMSLVFIGFHCVVSLFHCVLRIEDG